MKRGKKGQFYLIATIIIVAVLIGLSVALNYSAKTTTSVAEETAKELSIEAERVLDYEMVHPGGFDEFGDFAEEYSSYVGDDIDIYFIIVDLDNSVEEAYMYSHGEQVNLKSDLTVSNEIAFQLDSRTYNFKLEEGKNFYSIVVYDRGGDRYVSTI
jgi:hypothetical protein